MATLITGGTGFIGTEIARMLLNKGEKSVVLFDVNPSPKRLEDIAGRVEIVRGDLGNFSHVLDAVRKAKPRVIYHLGAMLSVPSDADPAAALRANALGTFHLLEAARLLDVSQVLFASSIATYGLDIKDDERNDYTLQRPQLFYGICKLFGENLGQFYKRKYGLDFRGVRYPSVVGPGVRTPGVVQYTSWMIEEPAKGNAYTVYVEPHTRCPVMYFKDAARALVELAEASPNGIRMVNYIIAGPTPPASADELAGLVRSRVPGARIDFKPDAGMQRIIEPFTRPLNDTMAQREWGWRAEYGQERLIDDFLLELKLHPQRYA